MSLSSGKASGKTPSCEHDFDPEYGQCLYCDRFEGDVKRIAELEAELAKRPHDYKDAMCCYEADQEIIRLKAEVERLKKVLSFAMQVLDEYEPEWREPMEEELKGGGRESESLLAKKATPRTDGVCPPHDYGSDVCRTCGEPNPAARKEYFDLKAEVERLTALCLRYQVNPYEGGGRETARKERDG